LRMPITDGTILDDPESRLAYGTILDDPESCFLDGTILDDPESCFLDGTILDDPESCLSSAMFTAIVLASMSMLHLICSIIRCHPNYG
jgi:hypothetical protein